MNRRRVLAWSLIPVLVCAALALVGARVAPARADTITRQIPSGGTTAIRGGSVGSGALQQPEIRPSEEREDEAAAARVAASERKMSLPSLDPSKSSQARSGCGINPSTLRSRLQMPAMLSRDPLGLAAPVTFPSVSQ